MVDIVVKRIFSDLRGVSIFTVFDNKGNFVFLSGIALLERKKKKKKRTEGW